MSAMRCSNCERDDVLVVRLAPKNRAMRFYTCRFCEHRWWQNADDGAAVELADVLSDLAS